MNAHLEAARPAARAGTSRGQANAALAVLFVVALFNHVDRTILSILQVPIKQDMGLSDTQLGALTGMAFAAVYCTLALPMSRVADRVVRKFLMAAALALWSIMTALSGLVTSFWMLVVLRMGVALGESCCSPTTLSLLSDYFPRARRGLPMAIWSTSVPVGTMLGLVGGGWLTAALGWRDAFIVVGLAGLLIVPAVLLLKEPRRGQFDDADAAAVAPPPLREALATLWRLKAMRWLLAAGSFQAFVLCALQLWSAPFYARVFQIPLENIGLVLGLLFGVGGGLGALLGGYLVDRTARRSVRWYGWLPALACLGMIPLSLGQYLVGSMAVSVAFGLGAFVLLNFYLAPLNAATQSLVPPGMRAFTSAMLLVFSNLIGLGLGPLFTGVVSDILTANGLGDEALRYALALTLLAALPAAACFYLASRHLARELR
ncbi:MFS transporter [Phenylobacterium sp.]|uniref:spinster family MFS transporter n=1 Tax=Phenylobacterium sp. TaxID=1871053 RepID=UPI00301B6DC2